MDFDVNKVIGQLTQKLAIAEGENAIMRSQLEIANETIESQKLIIQHYQKYGEEIKYQAEETKNVDEQIKELEEKENPISDTE